MYTAHYRKSDKKHQSVKDHLINASTFCSIYGKTIGIEKMSELVGLVHDMGKFSDEFQEYMKRVIEHDEDGTLEEWKKHCKKVDHGKAGGMYIYHRYHNTGGYANIAAEIIAMVVCYHHGGLHDYITFDCRAPLLERFQRKDQDCSYEQSIKRFFDQVADENYIDDLFSKACEEVKSIDKKIIEKGLPRTFSIHLLIKQLYSILIDADRYDTYLFMEDIRDEPSTDVKILWDHYSELLSIKLTELKSKEVKTPLEEKIKQLRLEVSDLCADFSARDTGIYTLTVPTGGGKTLSSLRFSLKHAYDKDKKRIIYVLPYTTIIEQNAEEIRKVLKCNDYLLEHHSNVINFNNDEGENYYRLLTQRWNSPIIFTTMVQFLETIYADGTQAMRRLHNLTDSILIFDEIQAIPIKCISLFNSAINYLSKICNATVILCSATQPNLSETKIHLLKENDGEIISDVAEKFRGFQRMKVVDRRIDGGYSYEALGNFIYELKKDLSSILIVMNTKTCAEKTYKVLKENSESENHVIFYLSTNLCPAHRKKIIKVMKRFLKQGKSVICVSTQLIESGVDISFEGIVRHLAGLDSVAQATGRGNRHGEGEIKYSYIINLADENLGNLKEIELGEKHTAEILYEYGKDPERFENDLLSPTAIKRYYKYYYADKNIEELMDYPVKVKAGTAEREVYIYKMLSGAVPNKTSYKDKYGKACELSLNFMFETAGNNFKVMDDLTTSVLVPYGKGKKIIADLFSSKSFSDKIEKLKLAQQYSINIYKNQKDRLISENALVLSEIPGIYVLKDGYYDKTLGIVTEKKMGLLLT